MLLREANIGGSAALCEMNRRSLGYDFPLEDTKRRLAEVLAKPGNKIFVAEVNGRAVGYIHLADYDCICAEPMQNLLGFAVLPEYQKRGVGSALLSHAESWAKAQGFAGIRLNSGSGREEAHAFYIRKGYTLRKLQKHFVKYL